MAETENKQSLTLGVSNSFTKKNTASRINLAPLTGSRSRSQFKFLERETATMVENSASYGRLLEV